MGSKYTDTAAVFLFQPTNNLNIMNPQPFFVYSYISALCNMLCVSMQLRIKKEKTKQKEKT